MPFITIEMSEHLQFSFKAFALDLNRYFSQALEVPIEKCKAAFQRPSESLVGEGEGSYARLKIELLPGRDREKLISLGNELLLRFSKAVQSQNPDVTTCRITVDFREIDHEFLFAPVKPEKQ